MGEHVELIRLLKTHLHEAKVYDESSWAVKDSPLGGRGVFATRDLNAGDIVFVDKPLVIGPRCSTSDTNCIQCYKQTTQKCLKGCGLPICSSACSESVHHLQECELIKKMVHSSSDESSMRIYKAFTPLRALLLDATQQKLLKSLAWHAGRQHEKEVNIVKPHLQLTEEQEDFIKIVCGVLDANAFEAMVDTEDGPVSLRGLYPLSSLLNHCCVPNTTHLFAYDQRMIVKASVPIAKGDEVFTSYCSVLWATTARRHHLHSTKHFLCSCFRCSDPTEHNTRLSAIRCLQAGCTGSMLPVNPLDFGSRWQCDLCNYLVSAKMVGRVQTALGSLLRGVDVGKGAGLLVLLRDRLGPVVPGSNHIAVEFKGHAVWTLGYEDACGWNDLSLDELIFKEEVCRELLEILYKLKMGQCKLRGLLLCELCRCMEERSERDENENTINLDVQEKRERMLQEAAEILRNDVMAPPEVKHL